ncbi:mechanosensitive ion channel family protein [Hoeflea prorocentri]|uniref:Mechanosensitive ion channel family protein n=1 Tax=Hoeflea prorocentri TaxID=1922333 RepID=A0A9X3UEP5_9HYPH|nr:mechanosensitive ion channel family protein [Hoeflea prorocentri]MCY6380028.1 mechanosensitive ion channel family protein [Hoeflea prorocentri]MDA5397828.1 mechanosensitive ion channel family protein [Hoeflea prorocentri]
MPLLSRFLVICALCLGIFAVSGYPSFAQTNAGSSSVSFTSDDVKAANKQIDGADEELDNFREKEDAALNDDLRLVELQQQLEDIAASMEQIYKDLQPRLESIKARETELGDPPGEGDPEEPLTLRQERTKLAADRAAVNAEIGEVQNVADRARTLAEEVSGLRRTLFRQTLLGRSDLSEKNFEAAGRALDQEVRELVTRISSWFSFTWSFERRAFLSAITLTLLFGVLFVYSEYRLFSRFVKQDRSQTNPSAFSKHTFAFWSTLLPAIGVAIFCSLALFFLDNFNVLRRDIANLLTPLVQFIIVLFFVGRLANAVLAPAHPHWRLVNVSDRGAHTLWWLIFGMTFINAFDYLAGSVSDVLQSPAILTIARSFVASVLIGGLLVLLSRVQPMKTDDGSSKPWPRSVSIPLMVLGLALILFSVFGYVGLTRFVATQVIILGALLVAMYLGFLSAKAVSEPEDFKASSLGQVLSNRFNLGPIAVEQIGLLCGLSIYVLVLVFGVPVIFLIWGYHIRDIQSWVADSFSQITVGNVTISLSGILVGLVVFAVGYFISRWFQRWLDENVMRRSRMETGLRNSVRTGIGYLGIAIAAIIGLSVAGLNLSNVALVAGALSVGIGFGLQNIVNNFVSGLILLIERPFKVGDWVVTGSTQGFVRHISVRATEIETFQRQSVIVPNSEFINTPVANWTHRNSIGRQEIAVGVSYDSDPRRVMAILDEIAENHDLVLRDPPPFVVFVGFGASSLDFELRVYMSDVLSGLSIATELRTQIFERFREEGIEIPFPQTDVHIKEPKDGEASVAEEAKKRLQAQAAEQKNADDPQPLPRRHDPDD